MNLEPAEHSAERKSRKKSRAHRKSKSQTPYAGSSYLDITLQYLFPVCILFLAASFYALEIHFPEILNEWPREIGAGLRYFSLCAAAIFFIFIVSRKSASRTRELNSKIESANLSLALKSSQMKSLTDDSPVPLFMLAQNGVCVYSNQAFATLLGVDNRTLVGQGWLAPFDEGTQKELLDGYSSTKDQKKKWSGIARVKDPSKVCFEVKMTPNLHEGEFVCAMASVLNLISQDNINSDRSIKEPILESATLDSTINHLKKRLSFPLKRISQNLFQIMGQVKGDSKFEVLLKAAQSDSAHMQSILEAVALSHLKIEPEGEKLEASFSPAELAAILETEIEKWPKSKKVSVGIEVDSNIPKLVKGDISKVRELLLLVADHSIQSTKCGGIKINMHYLPSEEQVCFEVIDTGEGLKPEDLAQLLSGNDMVGSKFESLHIAKGLVRNLGGALDIESMPKRGCVVQILVPARIEAGAQVKKETKLIKLDNVLPDVQGDSKMLIFEDKEKEVADVLSSIISRYESKDT